MTVQESLLAAYFIQGSNLSTTFLQLFGPFFLFSVLPELSEDLLSQPRSCELFSNSLGFKIRSITLVKLEEIIFPTW